MSNSLWPHGLQHTRLPHLSLSPGVCLHSCPLVPRCYLTISSFVSPFSFCFQSLPAWVILFQLFSNELAVHIRWSKYWSFSFSSSPSNDYSRLISFRIDLFDLLVVQGTLKSLLWTTVQKHQFFSTQPSLWANSHLYMTTGKTIPLMIWTFVRKGMSLLF